MVESSGLVERVQGLTAGSTGQQGFALATGLEASALAASLTGARRFTSLELALIADAHDVTVDWLLTGEPSVLMRAAHLPPGSTRALVERADERADLRESAARLGRPQVRVAVANEQQDSAAEDQGRALAEAALHVVHRAGRDVAEADLPTLIEDVFGIDVAVEDVGRGVDGLAVRTSTTQLIVVAATAAAARQRFTLGHELGHLLAGGDEVLHLDPDVHDVGDGAGHVQADAFARCFLGAEAVPVEAADAMGFAMSPRAPRLLRRDLYRAYQAGDTTIRPFAQLLGISSDQWREMLGPGVDEVP